MHHLEVKSPRSRFLSSVVGVVYMLAFVMPWLVIAAIFFLLEASPDG
jgi:uncharacterized membrane protein YciS (DUF1049 family)